MPYSTDTILKQLEGQSYCQHVSGTIGTTQQLVASVSNISLGCYITSLVFSAGASNCTLCLGWHAGGGVAPTGAAIIIPYISVPANTSLAIPLKDPIAVPANKNAIVSASAGTNFAAFCTYYFA